jgi:hypothetical protein
LATDYFVSTTGNGDGLSTNNPAQFNMSILNTNWLGSTNANRADITIYFFPGRYDVKGTNSPNDYNQRLLIYNAANRTIRLKGIPATDGTLPVLTLAALDTNAGPLKGWCPTWPSSLSPYQDWLLRSFTTDLDNPLAREYADRIEIENLEFDGNFDGQGALTSAANETGYKSFAIEVWAKTGRIRKVRVRNFGAVGAVPQPLVEGNISGVEAFPVNFGTFSVGQSAQGGDPTPWLIEDVDVSAFRTLHGGYGTMISGQVFTNTVPTSFTSPVALIRRCSVNCPGTTIAFGTAGTPTLRSGPIQIEDCVAVNGGLGFNTDTQAIGPWTVTNSVFLDQLAFGQLGQPNSGPNHLFYSLQNNLIRLRGWATAPTYADFYLTNSTTWGSNPDLPLGRLTTNLSNGLIFQGTAGNINFINNWFSTWPLDNFYLPDPTNTSLATFRAVWVVPPDTYVNEQYYDRPRLPAQTVNLATNRVSTTAFDFLGTNWLSNNSPSYLYTNSAPDYTGSRSALSSGSFVPSGRVERTLLLTNITGGTNPITTLVGVREVAFGRSYVTNTSLQVDARVANHWLPASGSAGTVPVSGINVWLTGEFTAPGSGSASLGSIPSVVTLSSGVATFQLSLPNTTGFCRLRAFLDSTADTNRSAWASLDLSLGTVVSLTATPDVGDDKNTITAKRAKLRFTRKGNLTNSLTVSFLLPTNGLASPVDNRNLIATHGTGANGDYSLIATGGASLGTITPGGTNTLTIPAGSAEAIVDIAPKADNLTEANVVRVILNPDPSYAIGSASTADVYIYDGPYWTLYGLGATVDLSPLGYPLDTAAYAINNATTPRIAGVVTNLTSCSATYGTAGAWWSGSYAEPSGILASSSICSGTNLYYSGPNRIPFSEDDSGVMVGWQLPSGSGGVYRAFRGSSNGSTVTLPSINGINTYGAGANAINLNGTFTVGYSFNGTTNRPVYWGSSGNATDLGEIGNTARTGTAYGINVSNVVVGVYQQTFGPTNNQITAVQGFRTVANSSIPVSVQSGAGDVLLAPSGYTNNITVPLSVNSAGIAVGYYQLDSATPVSAYWSFRGSGTTNSVASDGGSWMNPVSGSKDTISKFLSINDGNWVVGLSGDAVSVQRAVLARGLGATLIDLNDRHFLYGGAGWNLQSAVGINSNNWIIGKGKNGNYSRGFVLVPRVPGQ